MLWVSHDVRYGSLAASPRSTKKRRKSSTTIGNMCKNGVGAQPVLRAFFGQPAAQQVTNDQPCHVKAVIGPTGAQMTPTKCQIWPQEGTETAPKDTTIQRNNPSRIKACNLTKGWSVTSPQASSIRPPLRECVTGQHVVGGSSLKAQASVGSARSSRLAV